MILAEANTFLENNKMINIIFNYIFGLALRIPFFVLKVFFFKKKKNVKIVIAINYVGIINN